MSEIQAQEIQTFVFVVIVSFIGYEKILPAIKEAERGFSKRTINFNKKNLITSTTSRTIYALIAAQELSTRI